MDPKGMFGNFLVNKVMEGGVGSGGGMKFFNFFFEGFHYP